MITPELTVIIPTLNEVKNIRTCVNELVCVLMAEVKNFEILIVDDNSTDGTLDVIRDLMAVYPQVHLLVRLKEHGLSRSVVDGFKYAAGKYFVVMDADGQHPIDRIPIMYHKMVDGPWLMRPDIVIGSRYVPGGEIRNWGWGRRLISYGAMGLSRIFFPNLTDPASGFFAVRREVTQSPDIRPTGYKILIEILGKGRYQKVEEIPFSFGLREHGSSKLKVKTILEYVEELTNLFAYSLVHKEAPVHKELARICKFMVVGVSGIVVNMGLLALLYQRWEFNLLVSSVVAIEASVITNFLLNDCWTFGDMKGCLYPDTTGKFIIFNIVSFGGMFINAIFLWGLVNNGVYYLVANLVGILMAFAWNFLVNRNVTWGER
jgi:dolichol-phosphate mannosyltransferase